jgi:MFS family permease
VAEQTVDNIITLEAAEAEPWPTPARAWGVASLLMFAYFISYVDRTILSLLVDPIKHSLDLTDTKMGLIQGAFGLFFTVASFPAGWIADRGNRTRLIACGIACWSVTTALCGLCTSFIQLFLARMGIATGEAVLTPTAPSMIADNFPPERRTLPLSLYGMAGASGLGVSLITGGFVASLVKGQEMINIPGLGPLEPWQVIFFVVGLPGLLVSAIFFLAKEPARRDKTVATGSLRELWDVLVSRREIIVPHFLGICAYFIHAFSYVAWMPAFLMRVRHWSVAEVGLIYGSIHVVCAVVAGVGGGWFARVFWRTGRRNANLWTVAVLLAIVSVPASLAPIVSNGALCITFLIMVKVFSIASAGPSLASIQEIIPNRFRGRVTAIYFALLSIIGVTLGPLVIGMMNDYVFTAPLGIGKSLALTAFATLPLSALLVYIAARSRLKLDWMN